MPSDAPRPGPLLAIVVVLLALVVLVCVLVWVSWRPVAPNLPLAPDGRHPVLSVPQPGTLPPQHAVRWRPALRQGTLTILDKQWFVIGYDERRKNPAWVTYDLAGPITHPGPEPTRPATFQTDFATTARVSQHDYTGSHFDRGHMCPAYAMWSRNGEAGFLATFTCSNIIPQPHAVNAGIWEDLEVEVAGRWNTHGAEPAGGGWAQQFGRVTVINGPVYGQDLGSGRNHRAFMGCRPNDGPPRHAPADHRHRTTILPPAQEPGQHGCQAAAERSHRVRPVGMRSRQGAAPSADPPAAAGAKEAPRPSSLPDRGSGSSGRHMLADAFQVLPWCSIDDPG